MKSTEVAPNRSHSPSQSTELYLKWIEAMRYTITVRNKDSPMMLSQYTVGDLLHQSDGSTVLQPRSVCLDCPYTVSPSHNFFEYSLLNSP